MHILLYAWFIFPSWVYAEAMPATFVESACAGNFSWELQVHLLQSKRFECLCFCNSTILLELDCADVLFKSKVTLISHTGIQYCVLFYVVYSKNNECVNRSIINILVSKKIQSLKKLQNIDYSLRINVMYIFINTLCLQCLWQEENEGREIVG